MEGQFCRRETTLLTGIEAVDCVFPPALEIVVAMPQSRRLIICSRSIKTPRYICHPDIVLFRMPRPGLPGDVNRR